MITFDHDKMEGLLRDVAAKHIVPRFQMLADHEISSKSHPGDLVTIADEEAEDALEHALPDLYPGCVVIGEEGVSNARHTIETIADYAGLVFVVDPVDGTHNFVHGKDTFALMLAAVYKGETVAGWIYDIPQDRFLSTIKGEGAYWGGVKQRIAEPPAWPHIKGFASKKYFPAEARERISELRKEIDKLYSLYCAGHEYINIVTGKRHFSMYAGVKPWDHLAGALAVREAGGVVRMLGEGIEYVPAITEGVIVAAHSDRVFRDLQEFAGQTPSLMRPPENQTIRSKP